MKSLNICKKETERWGKMHDWVEVIEEKIEAKKERKKMGWWMLIEKFAGRKVKRRIKYKTRKKNEKK